MARTPMTFSKRQREQAKRDKKTAKAERKAARKSGTGGADEDIFEAPVMEIPEEESTETAASQ